MDEPTTKRCPACDQWLPLEMFNKNRAMRDGLQIHCNPCRKEINTEYRRRRPEASRAMARRSMRRRREADPEAVKAYQRKWFAENAERNRETRRAYFEANPDKKTYPGRAEWLKLYKAANPGKRREWDHRRRAAKFGGKVAASDLRLLWQRQCGICALCGERMDSSLQWPDPMSRSVDHIVPFSRGGAHAQGNLQWVHLVENLRKATRIL